MSKCFKIFIFIISFILSKGKLKSEYKGPETKLRQLTMDSLTKVTSNFYMLNYFNNYYLDDLLLFNNKDAKDIVKFAYSKFGTEYDFNILKLSSGFACSSFNVYNKENHNLFGRNFDYGTSPTIILWSHPDNHYKSISFIHGKFLGIYDDNTIIKDRLLLTPYVPMDGLNEVGVSISVLLLHNKSTHQSNPGLIDITTSILIRGILDTCANVEEAISFFKKYNVHDAIEGNSFHFMITDAKGDSVVIEYIDNEMKIIKPDPKKNNNYLYVTNFYLYPNQSSSKTGWDRYIILEENLNIKGIKMEWYNAMELLNKVHMGITLWSNVYDTKNLTVITAIRKDYSILYEFNIFEPLKKIITKLPDPTPEPKPTSEPEPIPTSEPDPIPTSETDPIPTSETDPIPTTEPELTSEVESTSEIEPSSESNSSPKANLFASYLKYSFFIFNVIFL